jgi:hypothetical protein
MITRIIDETSGKPDAAKSRIFIAKLSQNRGKAGSYVPFLEELEKNGIEYLDALKQMEELTPRRASVGKPRIGKEVAAVAKMLCRKYSQKPPVEMFEKFLETVQRPEFREGVLESLQGYESEHGRNRMGKIRTRPEREDMKARALKARAGLAKRVKKVK